MAGKLKTIYLTVCTKGNPFEIHLKKTFFKADEYNRFVNSPEFKEKYPESNFRVVKELY